MYKPRRRHSRDRKSTGLWYDDDDKDKFLTQKRNRSNERSIK